MPVREEGEAAVEAAAEDEAADLDFVDDAFFVAAADGGFFAAAAAGFFAFIIVFFADVRDRICRTRSAFIR